MTVTTTILPQRSLASETMPVLAVITNAESTQNKSGHNWIDERIANEPGVIHLRTKGPTEIIAALKKAADAQAKVVVVNGGDGTADLVFGGLLNNGPFEDLPAVALLSAGKTNMTADAWGFGKNKIAVIERIMQARREGTLLRHIVQRPILTVDRADGQAPLRGAFLGAADVVDGILFCRKHIYPLNLPNAISHAISIGIIFWRSLFAGSKATPVTARWENGEGESGRFFFMSATTLNKLVLNLVPTPADGHGPLNYLSLQSGPAAVLSAIPKLITKKLTSGTGHSVRSAETVKLTFDGAYTLDGELYQATRTAPLTISASDVLPFIDMPDL
jgi:hypothetical protein